MTSLKSFCHVIIVSVILLATYPLSAKADVDMNTLDAQSFDEVMQLIHKHYYRPIPDERACIAQIKSKGLSACLDDYSRLVTPEEMNDEYLNGAKSDHTPLIVAKIVADDTGYIRIANFRSPTEDLDILIAVTQLKVNKIIFDLRGNPGGSLLMAVKCLSLFEPDPDIPIVTERADLSLGRPDIVRTARDAGSDQAMYHNGIFSDKLIVAIVDHNTASTAEIYGGYLQQKGAIVVGEQTHRKDTVQEPYPLTNGNVLILTAYVYFLGSRRTKIDGHGITPNIITDVSDTGRAIQKALAAFAQKHRPQHR